MSANAPLNLVISRPNKPVQKMTSCGVHDRNGRGAPQPLGQAEPPQMLHRANARRLCAWPEWIRLDSRLDEQDADAAAAELDGGDEAARTAADNQHIDIAAGARHLRMPATFIATWRPLEWGRV